MSLKIKIKKLISKKKKNTKTKPTVNAFWAERLPLFVALFFFAFGMGLISDGKKIYSNQLRISQRVDYKASLNPYSTN